MVKYWNKNIRKRSHKRVSLLFPTLSKRKSQHREFEESLFILCSEHCKEDKQIFIQLWQSYNSYWNQTRLTNVNPIELQFLDNFMNKHIQDVEYFVDAQRSYLTETFHTISLPNIAPRKILIHSRCIL
jgi:hypothetical protein